MIPDDKLNQILNRHAMLERDMAANPDPETYVKLASEYSELGAIVVHSFPTTSSSI